MTNWKEYHLNQPAIGKTKINPTVLGFSANFHDSSVAIIKDNQILAAAEEERFSRVKHESGFPERAIQFCMDQAKINSVDAVVYFEDPEIKWQRILKTLQTHPPSKQLHDKIVQQWQLVKSKSQIQQKFEDITGLSNKIIFLDHHLSHAASSYLLSGFDKAAIVTIDAVGEKNTTAWGIGKNNHIDLEQCIEFPDSIGLMYTALTTFLGFEANDGESKVMGLAAYGNHSKKTNKYYALIQQLIDQNPDGSFKLDMQFFGHDGFEEPAYKPKIIEYLGIAPRLGNQAMTSSYQDIAAALQLVTEEAVFVILNYVYKRTGLADLCLAGGVALNSVLNGKILQNSPFRRLFVQPAAGDSGSALGAAKFIQHQLDPKAPRQHMRHSYFGPKFSDTEIKQYLDSEMIIYSHFNSEIELISAIAELLASQHVVGWFQGAMEWGPRALGHRSILASPIHSSMKDILNQKVKHREQFRPFAPVVCNDDADDYFDLDKPIPEPADYMLMVYNVKQQKRHLLPAITHIDGSARLQIVHKEQNKLLYDLLKEFGKLTGVPILVNTSFNTSGEPIVNSPNDAYKCMMGTEIDYMVLGKYLVERTKNLN